jgi:undecaprenyl-diphosphatase
MMAALWWLWFRRGGQRTESRKIIIATLASGFGALFIARILALTMPFRLRPLHTPEISFTLPYYMPTIRLEGWSSFPSDHAALFLTLAMGLLFISRAIGILGLSYAFLIICLPRL